MDPDNQRLIKELAETHGRESLVVVLGATDAEALQVAAETVTLGDPSYMGPLTGVPLGLQVFHIFEDAVKESVRPEVYEEEIGFLEMTLDADAVRTAMRAFRAAE
jgi:betaine reductase